ncbi:MAG: helix-turn-helix transcriptional regulator [Pseudomonadota bacterium]|jgi:DNA-binding CsgD family transcriptional regulator
MRIRLDRFSSRLQQARTLDELQAVIVALRDEVDIEHLVYHSVSGSGHQYAALTYSPAWVDRYIEQDYSRIDPVVSGCFSRFQPLDWKTLDWTSKPVRAFLSEALEAGVGNQGLSIPIRGPKGQFAMFTVSSRCADARWLRFKDQYTTDLILVAHFINQRALELERGTDFHESARLSPRELDALTMLAMGLSRSQASEWLSISEHTFRVYVESARSKLGANNSTHAVAKAIALGLVLL